MEVQSVERCEEALRLNNFDVHRAGSSEEARRLVMDRILPQMEIRTASWGDSLTLQATRILNHLADRPETELIRTFEEGVDRYELLERRRRALVTDLFLTGVNAVTETGNLVNLDMIGNRVAALAFGPKKVIVFAGRNKIVPDLEAARERIRSVAAPQNTARHGLPTPCVADGICHNCRSPKRICNTWVVTERCFPPGRIKVVLIDQDLGL